MSRSLTNPTSIPESRFARLFRWQQMLLLMVAVFVPAFGWVSMTVQPERYAAFPERFLVAAVAIAVLLGDIYYAPLRPHLKRIGPLLGVGLYLFFFRRAADLGMPVSHTLGLILIVAVTLLAIESRTGLVLYTAFVSVATAIGYTNIPAPEVSVGVLLPTFITLGLGFGTVNLARLRAEQSLQAHRDELEAHVFERTRALQVEVEERRAAELAAHDANEAKGRFLANMSHELRTPLNAMRGYTEMVREELVDQGQDTLAGDLASALAAGDRLLQMVSDVLDLSRIDAGRMEVSTEAVDVAVMLDELFELLEPARRRCGAQLERALEVPLTLNTDPVRASQIVLNLLTNALKFAPAGHIVVSAERDGDTVQIAVRDDGIGIAADRLDALFERFSQIDDSTTRTVEGAGLGLALSQDLAHRLGGTLAVTSTLGEGSTFTLELPVRTGR